MSRRDPFLRAASLILRHLAQPGSTHNAVDQAALDLVQTQRELEQTFQQLQKARGRGWQAAAAKKRSQLLTEAYEVQRKVAELIRCQLEAPSSSRPQSWSDVLADLRQLEDEFEAVEVRLKERVIAVHTDPITLRDVELGPFSIELHLERLRRRGSSSFECVALEPNPARCNTSLTHPHVSGKALCAGEATLPLSAALKEGRIADAFCLMNAVLHEYNPGSAYASLENWEGTRCEECADLIDSDDLNYCDGCDRRCCDGCAQPCDGCDKTYCKSCLEEDNEAEEHLCGNCRRRCDNCDRIVGIKQCDKETGLCPNCLEEQQDEEDEPTPDDLPEEPNEQPERPTAPSPVAAGG